MGKPIERDALEPQVTVIAPEPSLQLSRSVFLRIGSFTAMSALLAACGGRAQQSPPPERVVQEQNAAFARERGPIYTQSQMERIFDIGKAHVKAVDDAVNRFLKPSLLEKYRMHYRPPDLGWMVDATGGGNVFRLNFDGLLDGEKSRWPALYFTFFSSASFNDPFTVPYIEITADNKPTVLTDAQKKPSPPVEQLLPEVSPLKVLNGEDPKSLTRENFVNVSTAIFNLGSNFQWGNLEEVSGEKELRGQGFADDGQPTQIMASPGLVSFSWGKVLK